MEKGGTDNEVKVSEDRAIGHSDETAADKDNAPCLPENLPGGKSSEQLVYQDNEDGSTGLFLYDCFFCLKKKLFPAHVKTESKALIKLAWGISLNSFLSFIIPVCTVLLIGHKGKIFMAGIGLGLSVCNVTGNVLAVAVTSASETLCSQAYGTGNLRRYGILVQRIFIITCITVLPTCALWINMDKLLLLTGQEREVALLAGQFAISYIPGLFLFILLNVLVRYLACQNIAYPVIFGSLVAFVVNGLFCYIFVYVCDLGVRGGALGINLSYLSFCVFILVFIYLKRIHEKTWYGLSTECFVQWKEMIHLAIPTTILVIMEWIVFELGIIAIGMISSLEQAALIILFYIGGSIYYIAFGISIGTAVRVGNFLGAGHPKLAKNTAKVSVMLIVVGNFCIGLLVAALKDVIGYVFITDREVIDVVSKSVLLVALYGIFDGVQIVCIGSVRGIGYQKYGALINFIGYICIGIPTYLLLIFKARLATQGFWLGALVGISFQVLGLGILLCKADWNKLSILARERSGMVVDTSPIEDEEHILQSDSYGATEVHFGKSKRSSSIKEDHSGVTSPMNGAASVSPREFPRAVLPGNEVAAEDMEKCEIFFENVTRSNSKLDTFFKILVILLCFILILVSLLLRVVPH